ncbi:hypothetical protein, partial [Lyngbya confervoides]
IGNYIIAQIQILKGLTLTQATEPVPQFTSQGKLLSKNLTTYKIPDIFFMPQQLEIQFRERENQFLTPYGSKAVGEPPLMYGIGVFFAIRHAMRAFRPNAKLTFKTPLTPEQVLCALYAEELGQILSRLGPDASVEDHTIVSST